MIGLAGGGGAWWFLGKDINCGTSPPYQRVFNQALAAAKTMEDAEDRVGELILIAEAKAEAGDVEGAPTTAKTIERIFFLGKEKR